jgi:hypothetical protein
MTQAETPKAYYCSSGEQEILTCRLGDESVENMLMISGRVGKSESGDELLIPAIPCVNSWILRIAPPACERLRLSTRFAI